MVTELCQGSLYSLLHASGKKVSPSPLVSLSMALDAARGLFYLHGQGVIHCDFKTANLLVVDVRGFRVKVRRVAGAQHGATPHAWRAGREAPQCCLAWLPGLRTGCRWRTSAWRAAWPCWRARRAARCSTTRPRC